MNVIADTSYVVALVNESDKQHEICLHVHRQQTKICLPQTTLSEVAYLLTRDGGNRVTAHFLQGLSKSKYKVEALLAEDLERTAELLFKYADSRLDFVDATVAAVAERLNITRILTLAHRDFSLLRPRHCDHFELLP